MRRRHSPALQRRLVERTPVARVALANGVNANLLFKWRRQYVRAKSGSSALRPVMLSEPKSGIDAFPLPPTPAARMSASSGVIQVELPAGRIRIRGAVDVPALRVVLQMWVPAA